MGHNWTRRAMAFCRRCPQYWGRSTGSIHYGGSKRVTAERIGQDQKKLEMYQKKTNYIDAFTDFVQEMSKWIPKSVTHCPV